MRRIWQTPPTKKNQQEKKVVHTNKLKNNKKVSNTEQNISTGVTISLNSSSSSSSSSHPSRRTKQAQPIAKELQQRHLDMNESVCMYARTRSFWLVSFCLIVIVGDAEEEPLRNRNRLEEREEKRGMINVSH